MNTDIFFTVVIPTYNREHIIPATLHSLVIQSFRNFEVIVVDDGSNDNTGDVVKALNDDRFIYVWKENGERAAARNYGGRMARGQYILFLDSDDFLHPDALLSVFNEITLRNKVDFLVCGYEIRTPDMTLLRTENNFQENELKVLTNGNPFGCGSNFVHRDVFSKFQFCEKRNVSHAEDWEYWIRLCANFGYQVYNKVIAYVIDHPKRSVRVFKGDDLIRCKEFVIKEAFTDSAVNKKFLPFLHRIKSNSHSYISLHLALSGYKFKSVKYLLKSAAQRPLAIFSRRTLATFKHLIISW
jgi:glycosyltransferase involved in cell wall biosynthesis